MTIVFVVTERIYTYDEDFNCKSTLDIFDVFNTREGAYDYIINRINLKKEEGFEDECGLKISENGIWKTPTTDVIEEDGIRYFTYYKDNNTKILIGAHAFEVK